MASVPVRLSAQLAARAREAARVQDRSLTDQVEHWARLGELIEAAVSGAAIEKLKTVSHDDQLSDRLASADTEKGRVRTQRLLRRRGGPWHETTPDYPTEVTRREQSGAKIRGKVVNGKLVPTSSSR